MTTPQTRARLGALERQLTTPTPAPLDGQTALPVPDRTGATMPTRIQRHRTRGWKKPDNAVIVDRTSRFGNPLSIDSAMDAYGYDETEAREYVVRAFRSWLRGIRTYWESDEADQARERILTALPDLVGKDLACACAPDELCHADVLLEWAADPNLGQRITDARTLVDQVLIARGEEPLHAVAGAAA
ncbi:DUF4326 domain-containing protein [Streptomyces hydrogenans]|uniref:DUF4326 domain-containing protein n=1 Tax=Streptomyces hydrogenans TaxID=1873719 RepID=UPI0036F134B9